MPTDLRSFDAFDTLLTRTVAVPHDLFQIVGDDLKRSGLLQNESSDFARQRAQAETEARQCVSHREVILSEIYEILGRELRWQPDEMARAMQMEMEIENQNLRAVPGMIHIVNKARNNGVQVLFLTDMYLPATFIEMILRREGFFKDGDKLFVSGESRHSKHSGQMFVKIKSLFPNITSWAHVGDNFHADIKMARQFGITTSWKTCCHLSRYEQLARGQEKSVPLWRSQLAGAMRLARLENSEVDEHRRTIWDTGCGVVGPLLFGFAHWCLETARQRGLRRLYFIARDGQILYRIAKIITDNWNYGIECRYLYGSRQAWHPAAVNRFNKDEFHKFFIPGQFLSLQHLFKRLGLPPENFRPQMKKFRLAELDTEKNMDSEARQRVEEFLLDIEIAAAVENASQKKRVLLLTYLKQEGFFDGLPFALVDIGWFGNMQKSLERTLEISGNSQSPDMSGFYFNLTRKSGETSSNMFDYWHTFATRKNIWRNQYMGMFEIFTAADHGSTIGFEKEGDQIAPLLTEENNRRALAWGLAALHKSILRFSELFSENAEPNSFVPADFFPISLCLFDDFYLRPSAAEAAAWGSFQHSGGQTEGEFEQMVPNWNRNQIISALWNRKKQSGMWWQEGSLAICPCLPLALFLFLKHLKQRLKNR